MSNDDWRDYVPPTDRGEGERALPRGMGSRAAPPAPTAPAAGSVAAGGAVVQPKKGKARLSGHRACYVNADCTAIVGEQDARAKGIVRKGGDKRQSEWTRFHSTREAKRWIYLRGLERAGKIKNLRRQVKFPLLVARPDKLLEQIATWTCDFDYEREIASAGTMEALADVLTGSRWEHVVEDSKGFKTEIYERSKKHFEAQYGIRITET